MEIQLPVHAMLDKRGYIILKDTCKADYNLVIDLFKKKAEWEKRNEKEYFLNVRFDLRYQKRTYKQNASVWKLVTAIFQSQSEEGRNPTEEEKYGLYLDLLEVYADKTPNKITGGLRPVHISESNSIEGARFIDGLLYHLSTECDLEYGTQVTVQGVLQEWEEWRGSLEVDPIDYKDIDCADLVSESEWRRKRPYSEASGKGGNIVRAHVVSRGADAADIEMSWNWIALTQEEHAEQHRRGWDEFLQIYPHLRGRVDRARKLAGKIEFEFKRGQKAIEDSPEDLALAALGDESSEERDRDSWAWSELHDTD
jgi:hypothetical protein